MGVGVAACSDDSRATCADFNPPSGGKISCTALSAEISAPVPSSLVFRVSIRPTSDMLEIYNQIYNK